MNGFYRIGIDVGGTFTDFLLVNDLGESLVYKTPTTPKDPTEGVFTGLKLMAGDKDLSVVEFLSQVKIIVHGTTITTNATLTGEGAKTGFITTKGFRDCLNMRRGMREEQYNPKQSPPPPLVPRYLIQVVDERVNCEGHEVTPLNEDDVRRAIRFFKQEGVEAVAVSLLFSFFNPAHEQRIKEIITEEAPGLYVSLSSEVLPQVRVYERHSTTALNAYVGPPLSRYLTKLKGRLAQEGFGGTLLIMQSNGGVMAPEIAIRFASNTLLSGPASGPTAGVFYAESQSARDIITIDMGGTSFDVCLVKDKKPAFTEEGQVGGYRLASPIIDIHTIGAGGGSIAWVDPGGILCVGPKSAGSEPGPVCYGHGGTQPTVTDANLVLGYLAADFFYGGKLKLDLDSARRAVGNLASELGLDIETTAAGIYKIVNANMADGVREVSVRRGHDPREFALVVAGGAGPIHAAAIASELDISLIIIPRESSVFCAAGMLISDLKHDFVRTYNAPVGQHDLIKIKELYQEMRDEAMRTLAAEGISREAVKLLYRADLRYIGQFNDVGVVWEETLIEDAIQNLSGAFHKRHDTLYGYSMPGAPLEFMNLRMLATGVTDKPSFNKFPYVGRDASDALKGERPVYFDGNFINTPVYDGLRMGYGNLIQGPAIVEQPTTTIIVTPEFDLTCDEYNDYILYPKGVKYNHIPR
ncbi:hydantoinase/oxoprolinase family protein [Desulfoscipio gibsoniae]|uniref:N-methylhydantoinase A/acetone carboxylase, beta subunit n=1 Tax=Desulfoscipio gibsoniae DSM 7213 TaxID=767817 RepID=R4KG70_9FIRM|nr:hydantoinase/oxoprolinase family protein [Desulfoscipio gibsoniae]AGL00667.1 N-methylhydantoinase A/acetone carboxylase, beta subunit [Desulfoscipio gibsoniae DSM 7213]